MYTLVYHPENEVNRFQISLIKEVQRNSKSAANMKQKQSL